MIEHYDWNLLGKGVFPFRMTDFYVAPDIAKEKLGWGGPEHNLKSDLSWYFEGYKARGGETRKLDLGPDREIVIGHKTLRYTGSIYDKWDPLIVDTSDIQPLIVEID